MKPVQDMLNFLWKKTSRKSTGEPPIIQASSVNGDSHENVHRFKQKSSRPNSMYVETNGNFSRTLQVSSSTSLDEHRFLDACVNPNENHAQNGELDAGRRDMPCKNALKHKSESQLNSLSDEPAKYYNSPKISSRYLVSGRSSGHSRSHSVYSNVHQGNSERTATKTELEGTPRMYKKNPSNKIVPHHGGLGNASFDGSTTGSCHSDSHGSQWSFWEEGSSEPVPPPRKRRSKPREAFSETSSQSSTDRTDITRVAANSDGVAERRHSDNDLLSPVCGQDPMEFNLYLPPGFSDLGLDLLAVEFNTEEVNSDWKPSCQANETAEHCTRTLQHDVLRLESTLDREIVSTCAERHSNCDSVSLADDEETRMPPQATKLRSETIVQSLFAKGGKYRDGVLNSDSVETEEQTQRVVIDENAIEDKLHEQNHHVPLPKALPEFPDATKNGFTKISEYHDARVEQRTGMHNPWYHESSTDDVFYSPVSDETEWTIAFCSSSGTIQRSCGNGAQPDVLIGTQLKALSSSLSSLPTDSDLSFDACQEDNKGVEEDVRLSVEKELGHDLVVFHELQGSLSSIIVKVGERSTSQEVIEEILHQEKLPADWHLYTLCTKSLDPKVINNDCVELDFRDCPLMHLKQTHKGGNIQFELHQKDGIQIRVTCDAGLERTRTMMLGISCGETCENVLDIAARKFGLNSAAKLCLIQVDRNEKGCPMKRVPENQIIAQLHSDYFLLCEREFLSGAAEFSDPSYLSSSRAKSRSRSYYSPDSQSIAELNRLERKVADLEAKLAECERNCQQKLHRQQNQMDRYRAIAFCTDPVTKAMLLEAEIQRLTNEMQEQQSQMHIHRGFSRTSSQSEYEMRNYEDELTAMKKSLSAIEKERTETYALLTTTRTEELETHKTSTSKRAAPPPPLYSVCRESQGSCVYGFQVDRSSLTGGQEHLPFKNDINHIGNGQSNGGLSLMEGDRILEINGQPVHHLNEAELLSVVGGMTKDLRVVVLREETPTTDIYVL